jgi:hypothetical protein
MIGQHMALRVSLFAETPGDPSAKNRTLDTLWNCDRVVAKHDFRACSPPSWIGLAVDVDLFTVLRSCRSKDAPAKTACRPRISGVNSIIEVTV